MGSALIGHTGFVGANLLRQAHFDDCYNSANIENIVGKWYDLLVCAGAPGEKWRANKEPSKDLAALSRLRQCLNKVDARQVLLMSTIDVYPSPVGVDEDTAVGVGLCAPYGKHRAELETFVASRFPALIVRLPGLFGKGLKKNIIFDLLHDSRVDHIDPDSTFQLYDLDNLWLDIRKATSHGITLLNLATEPIRVREIATEAFGRKLEKRPGCMRVEYDVRTKYGRVLGNADEYIYDKQQVLTTLSAFVARQRQGPS